jgi:hypothetical protein
MCQAATVSQDLNARVQQQILNVWILRHRSGLCRASRPYAYGYCAHALGVKTNCIRGLTGMHVALLSSLVGSIQCTTGGVSESIEALLAQRQPTRTLQ